ncbi:MAG: hypothetical protein ACRDX9_16250 [Acidimicrobiia bacterium]
MPEYWELVGQVAATHVDEIRGDLDQARHRLRQARQEVADLESRIGSLEALLALTAADHAPAVTATMTLHEAMSEVIRSSGEQIMRAADLATEIDRRGLYKMRDGRPVEAQQIHARVGNYPHLFSKVGTFITLAEDTSLPG